MNGYQKNNFLAPAITSFLFLYLLSLWVPINLYAPSIYFDVDNFHGIRPRSIVGSIIYLLPIDKNLIPLAGNSIKLISLFLWLFFIISELYNSIFDNKNLVSMGNRIFAYLALSFIFASSSMTYITYSSAGLIDVFPAAIVAFIITSRYLTHPIKGWTPRVILITIMLLGATWAHEKTIYDIGILIVWFSLIWGLKKGLIFFAPALILSASLLIRMANKVTSGESPAGYLKIFQTGVEYFWINSFSTIGILAGGGALWGLYLVGGFQFMKCSTSIRMRWHRFIALLLMMSICFLPLLVALDTSRLVALIWLPAFLLLQQLDLNKVFRTKSRKITLLVLCIFQALIPPALIYQKGIAAFNCYGLWIGELLPKRPANFEDLGPFGIYAHSRPDFTNFFITQCKFDYKK